ncbi:HAMP domain-containing sensor histidine kinase [uncultured Deinococcus sp.]|uniref:HAMP domain-containing sensor histidine kinase n=1 Tax=uncultured Deinococcus sp. TaxID=158789 RepID=UPI0025F56AD2|nr:HAMP domain-containing sensor histidine kinase [uncultured Deinococcus sp.]
MTLRARVALIMALGIAAALLLQGVLGYLSFQRLVINDLDHDLSAFTERILTQSASTSSLGALRPTYEGYVVHARVLSGTRVVADLTGATPALPIRPRPGGVRTVGPWRVTQVPLTWRGQALTLQTALTSPEFTAGLRNYRTTLLFTALLVSALGAAVAYTLSGYALSPLRALTRASARIAESGRLDQTVPVTNAGQDELHELACTFNLMLARLTEFRAREARFNRQAAHELRTPLAAMRLTLDSARSGYVDSGEALEALDVEMSRTQRLTTALLVLAQEGRLTQTEPVNLAALAKVCASKTAAHYSGPDEAWVSGDTALIRRALDNLLENAARHAPGAEVWVTLLHTGQMWLLSVIDSGPGVADDLRPQLTDEFVRAGTRGAPGAGLGLSVVRHIMAAHGSEVQIEPAEPHGLKVSLRFLDATA